jgi:hypothetical protein
MVTWVDRHERTCRLRAAVHGKDGNAVVEILRTAGDSPSWQLAGDGVAAALAQKVDGARQLAVDAAAALRERGWIGDAELADQLDGLAGSGPTPLLRPLTVDLEMVSEILEGDPLTTGGALDLQTGQVWPRSVVEYAGEDGADVDAPDFDDVDRFAGWTAIRATATATWSSSSAASPTSASRTGSTTRFADAVPSAASPTRCAASRRTS